MVSVVVSGQQMTYVAKEVRAAHRGACQSQQLYREKLSVHHPNLITREPPRNFTSTAANLLNS